VLRRRPISIKNAEVVLRFELQVESNPKYQEGQSVRGYEHGEFGVKGLIIGEI
jgi:hypothetical protein